jgi:chaperonin GroES
VIATGPGKLLDNGHRAALAVSKGDEVLYGRYAGTDVVVDRKELKIMRESDILAKVVK